MTDAFDFTRYLASKRTVDDRALNRQVWQTLADAVNGELMSDAPLRVLEVGAGIGTHGGSVVSSGVVCCSGFTLITLRSIARRAMSRWPGGGWRT